MKNLRFFDAGNIRLFHDEDRDNNYDDCNTLNRSIDQNTKFTVPDTKETTSSLRLRQKVKQDILAELYRHFNITGDPDLADIDQFLLKKLKSR